MQRCSKGALMRFLLPVLQLYALETLLMIQVTIKNAGKVYPLEIDLKEPGLTLKLQIYSLTNIPLIVRKFYSKAVR